MLDHRLVISFAAVSTIGIVVPAIAQTPSPYAGEQGRAVKALSPEETADYLAGKGMGLARAAELNGYPGPMHVLELSERLGLTPEQKTRTEALFASMRGRAITAGRALLDEERALDELFRSRTVTPETLSGAMRRIGERQAEVRRIHLDAHLAQAQILRQEQLRRYNELRGYAGKDAMTHTPGRHGGH